MKERIVIKDTEQTFNIVAQFPTQVKPKDFEHTIERVPEKWEELKELCKEFGEIEIIENNIYFRGMTFRLNGTVEDFEGNIIGENRTPQQMWAIIKNLIG